MFNNNWLTLLRQETEKEKQEKTEHPLASLKQDNTPTHPQASNVTEPSQTTEKKEEPKHPLEDMLKSDFFPQHPKSENVTGGETKHPSATPDSGTAGTDKKEESEVAPVDWDVPLPTESDLTKEAAETRAQLAAQAEAILSAGQSERQSANAKSDELYKTLRDFTTKQDGRYDELLAMILANDYRSAGSTGESIFYDYLTEGKRAAADAAAAAAGDNGGNGDSYSAALAARAMNRAAAQGDSTAREYYGEQLDRILKVIQAAGGDMTDLFNATQNNVDTAQGVAGDDLSLGADLLAALADAQEAGQKIELSVFSELLDKAAAQSAAQSAAQGSTAGADTATGTSSSPMQIDKEYAQMTTITEGGDGMLPADALIVLWDKYPDMRDYILQKYQEVLHPSYTFGES